MTDTDTGWVADRLAKEQSDYTRAVARRMLTAGFVCGFVVGAGMVALVWTRFGLLQWGCP